MCLIVLSHRMHPRWRLFVAANRDEFYARPTAAANYWDDAPDILAGRDLQSGGTWLGLSASGSFAAVTNFRDGLPAGSRSRGELVASFLRGAETAADASARIEDSKLAYAGFSLLLMDGKELYYVSNRIDSSRALDRGVYALSNGVLDAPWPKSLSARRAVEEELTRGDREPFDRVLEVLADRKQFGARELPETGVGAEMERRLSSVFIHLPRYGTRSSTIVAIGDDDRATFIERRFNARGTAEATSRYEFDVTRSPR